jgi:hypothetical protein
VAFFRDMGPCPPGETLDRKDHRKGYTPTNCRWATPTEQARNRSTNNLLTFRGETLPAIVWAERFDLKLSTLLMRMTRYGWTVEKALTTPPGEGRKAGRRFLTFRQETKSVAEWSRGLHLTCRTIYARLTRGWSTEKTLTTPNLKTGF